MANKIPRRYCGFAQVCLMHQDALVAAEPPIPAAHSYRLGEPGSDIHITDFRSTYPITAPTVFDPPAAPATWSSNRRKLTWISRFSMRRRKTAGRRCGWVLSIRDARRRTRSNGKRSSWSATDRGIKSLTLPSAAEPELHSSGLANDYGFFTTARSTPIRVTAKSSSPVKASLQKSRIPPMK
jgi:hypothetical protein